MGCLALSSEIGDLSELTKLLQCLRANTIAGPCSSQLSHLLASIDAADPDEGIYEEDDTNGEWGHYQFRHGLNGFSFQGINWCHVGNTATACHVLASTIKSCKVARHLCHRNNIKTQSFLADIYLKTIVENLSIGMEEILKETLEVCVEVEVLFIQD